jgi:pyruvate/2-oxoglutarate dehydrogenase complex dihydrolipoamide dehydrogenase (E3) component
MKWKRALIKDFADCRETQLRDGRFKFIRAMARFEDPHTLKLGNGKTLTAGHFVISTGSVVSPPPVHRLTEVGYITSDDVLSLKRLPKSLMVLGGGAIAAELAQFLVRFGVKISMIQRSPQILSDFDADAAKAVETALRRDGIQIYAGSRLFEGSRDGREKVIRFEYRGKKTEVRGEEFLLALGRSPNTAGLGLEKAGVMTKAGCIVADPTMQTSADHIYAAGDCTGPYEIVHIAIQQGETAVHNIIHPRKPRRMDYRLLMNVVLTDPQIASVGLTEKEATAKKVPYLAASYPFNDHGKSLIMGALDGFVKLLANPRTGEIIGGCCTGPMGGDLIHEVAVAMAKRMTVHEFAITPHYHPTLAEIWTYPAEELAEKIRNRG